MSTSAHQADGSGYRNRWVSALRRASASISRIALSVQLRGRLRTAIRVRSVNAPILLAACGPSRCSNLGHPSGWRSTSAGLLRACSRTAPAHTAKCLSRQRHATAYWRPSVTVPGPGTVTLGRQYAVACLCRDRHFAVCAGAVLLQARSNPADVDRQPDGWPRFEQRLGPHAASSIGALTDRTRIAVRSLPRSWTDNAIRLIEADARRSADTHLLRYPLPSAWCADVDIALYLKDETTHITGSLKHRLARSFVPCAPCNGWIGEGTTVVEASSGSTAVSEAYFAALLGLPFVAVMPSATSSAKVALIESQGGRCHFVADSSQVYAEAERVAKETGGDYPGQFTKAERAT